MSADSYQLDVLFEDNHLLVVNKPPLLPTMGVKDGDESLYRLAGSYLKKKYNKPGNVYVGIVSRLDAHVTGVIVLARTSKAASRLSDQMRRRTIEKRYLALVPAGLRPLSNQLSDRVVKNESRHRMEVVKDGASAVSGEMLATLRYQTLATDKNRQLIQVELETGRKHQIRVQLENTGFPIIGDRKYGSERTFSKGIALHCHKISFEHPTQKVVQSFQADPPEWWQMNRFEKG